MPALERWVYSFGDGRADGSAAMRDILGGKGAGLAEMANLGLPVPPGFTISAKLCIAYLEHGTFPDDLREEVDRHLKQLERLAKKRLDRKSTRLNSSHLVISYAVFCLK